MRKVSSLVALASVAFIVAVALPPTVQAHDVCATHYLDVGCSKEGDSRLDTCDREADGHYVRAHYYRIFDPSYHHGPWDGNGSQSGCSHLWVTPALTSIRVCEDSEGCGAWRDA